jgi:hypothetical protein
MGEELIAIVAIVVLIGIPLMIPIIAMLLKHQRTMAEIIHSRSESEGQMQEQVKHLAAEVSALRTELEYRRLANPEMSTTSLVDH